MTTDTNHILLRLALAKKECPAQYHFSIKDGGCKLRDGTRITGCDGTDRVYLVEGVREECAVCDGTGYMGYTKDFPCEVCRGRSWTATTDPEKLAQGLWPLMEQELSQSHLLSYQYVAQYVTARASGHDAEAWEAAARALEEAGMLKKETP